MARVGLGRDTAEGDMGMGRGRFKYIIFVFTFCGFRLGGIFMLLLLLSVFLVIECIHENFMVYFGLHHVQIHHASSLKALWAE